MNINASIYEQTALKRENTTLTATGSGKSGHCTFETSQRDSYLLQYTLAATNKHSVCSTSIDSHWNLLFYMACGYGKNSS